MRYHPCMGQLLVRNVPDETIAALRAKAAHNGRSMEAELREMLRALADPAPTLRNWLAEADQLREETRGRGGASSQQVLREERDAR